MTTAHALEAHQVANIFPMMSEAEIADLARDIEENGQREPVWLYGGQIIDGRNRAAACARIGREPSVREFVGGADGLLPFVVSLNLKRRHLTESQRAMVAANIANLPQGVRADRPANLPVVPVTQAEAATLLNVSERSVRAAAKVRDEAPSEIAEAVTRGDLPVSLAAEVTKLAETKQITEDELEAVAIAPPDAIREIAREVVKRAHVANNAGNNEWYTPPEFIERARQAMGGIDFDPATSEIANRTVQAETFYTADDDGRAQRWSGRVWMNPPYAQPLIADFAEAAAAKYESGEIEQACILVNNGTETQWFQRMLAAASAVCFPQGRVRFLDPDGNPGAPLQGQAVLYLGKRAREFRAAFAGLGAVLFVSHGGADE